MHAAPPGPARPRTAGAIVARRIEHRLLLLHLSQTPAHPRGAATDQLRISWCAASRYLPLGLARTAACAASSPTATTLVLPQRQTLYQSGCSALHGIDLDGNAVAVRRPKRTGPGGLVQARQTDQVSDAVVALGAAGQLLACNAPSYRRLPLRCDFQNLLSAKRMNCRHYRPPAPARSSQSAAP